MNSYFTHNGTIVSISHQGRVTIINVHGLGSIIKTIPTFLHCKEVACHGNLGADCVITMKTNQDFGGTRTKVSQVYYVTG